MMPGSGSAPLTFAVPPIPDSIATRLEDDFPRKVPQDWDG